MGSFRRRIVVNHRSLADSHVKGGEARAVLEDDFHHFRVSVRHEHGQVTHIDGQALRTPYSLCPSAVGQLPRLVGMRLDTVASAVARATDATEQCTHLLDLAGLAIAAAARGRDHRHYDIEVADRLLGHTRADLLRNGQPLMSWDVQDTTIAGPPPFAGVSLRHGLARFALETLSPDQAEAAIVLRRCAMISLGRLKNLDATAHAVSTGRCYVQQPARAEQALRIVGSTWDFSRSAADLCATDAQWLAWDDTAA